MRTWIVNEEWVIYFSDDGNFTDCVGHRCKPTEKFFTSSNVFLKKECRDCKMPVPNEVMFVIELDAK